MTDSTFDQSGGTPPPPEPKIHAPAPNQIYARLTVVVLGSLRRSQKKLRKLLKAVATSRKRVLVALPSAEHARRVADQANGDADVSRERVTSREPVGGIDHGRGMPRWIAWIITGICIALLAVVDASLLSVLLLPMLTTRLVTVTIVIGSAAAAHVAGKIFRREHDCDVPELELSRRERVLGRVVAALGVTVEVMLGVIRAVKTGSVLTSSILVAAGLALWFTIAWVAYRSHADLVDDAERANRLAARRGRHAAAEAGVLDRRLTAYWATRDELRVLAAAVVADAVAVIEKTRALWAREHPGEAVPAYDEPEILALWRRYAAGEVPPAYDLGDFPTPGGLPQLGQGDAA